MPITSSFQFEVYYDSHIDEGQEGTLNVSRSGDVQSAMSV